MGQQCKVLPCTGVSALDCVAEVRWEDCAAWSICRPSRRGWSTNSGQRWLGRTDHQSREGLYEVMGVTSDWVAWWLRNS